MAVVGAGVGLLGRALGHIGKLKGILRPAVNKATAIPWASAVKTAAPAAAKVPPTAIPWSAAAPVVKRGVINPLTILAGTVTAGTGLQMASGVGDWIKTSNVGIDKTGDLDSLGQTFDGNYNVIDRLRLSLGALQKGHWGEAFLGPNDETKQAVMEAAQKQRAKDIKSTYSRELTTNAQSLGGLNPLVSRTHNFVGRDINDIEAGIESDAVRGAKVQQILGIEGGIEKLAELDPNATTSVLTGAATQLNTTNRNKAEEKVRTELKRQQDRIDNANRIERERQDANQRLQLLLNDNALVRADKEAAAAREERNYMTMLELREKRATRRDQRIRDEKQSQREMIAAIMGGLNNAFN